MHRLVLLLAVGALTTAMPAQEGAYRPSYQGGGYQQQQQQYTPDFIGMSSSDDQADTAEEDLEAGAYTYQGMYEGSCDMNGLYYKDETSFVICSGGNGFVQPCAPGTNNSPYENYDHGGRVDYRNFCDVNMLNYGFRVIPPPPRKDEPGQYRYDEYESKSPSKYTYPPQLYPNVNRYTSPPEYKPVQSYDPAPVQQGYTMVKDGKYPEEDSRIHIPSNPMPIILNVGDGYKPQKPQQRYEPPLPPPPPPKMYEVPPLKPQMYEPLPPPPHTQQKYEPYDLPVYQPPKDIAPNRMRYGRPYRINNKGKKPKAYGLVYPKKESYPKYEPHQESYSPPPPPPTNYDTNKYVYDNTKYNYPAPPPKGEGYPPPPSDESSFSAQDKPGTPPSFEYAPHYSYTPLGKGEKESYRRSFSRGGQVN